VITSAPIIQVRKTSLDISGDPLVLMAGDRLRYTITVKISAMKMPAMSRCAIFCSQYHLCRRHHPVNGVAVPDVAGVSALQSGMLVNAPENLAAGVMRARCECNRQQRCNDHF